MGTSRKQAKTAGVKKQNPPSSVRCGNCHLEFATMKLLFAHRANFHQNKIARQAAIEFKAMTGAVTRSMTAPRAARNQQSEFKCKRCKTFFKSLKNLTRHNDNSKCGRTSKKGHQDVVILFSTNLELKREFQDPYFNNDFDVPQIINAPKVKLELANFNGRYKHQELIDLTEMENCPNIESSESKINERSQIPNIIVPELALDDDGTESGALQHSNTSFSVMQPNDILQNVDTNEPHNRSVEHLAESRSVNDEDAEEDCLTLESQPSVLNNAPLVQDVEDDPLFMSDAIHQRAVSHPKELMIVWSNSLEGDLLTAASVNRAHCLLCIRDFYAIHLTENQTKLLKSSHNITFMTLDLKGAAIQWTILSFAVKYCPIELCNRTFNNSLEREKLLTEFAAGRGMTIRNLAKVDTPGLLSSVFYRPGKEVVEIC